MTLATILLVIALVLAVCAAFGVSTRVGLFPLSFAFFIAATLLAGHEAKLF